MAHIYMHFDFGADEEKAQEARHKLDVWKQAFRLDKKLQYKLDRPEQVGEEEARTTEDSPSGANDSAKTQSKSKVKVRNTKHGNSGSKSNGSGNVSLLVRLYFSSHEKLSQQRWLDRIPTEEPFKDASPKVIRQGEAGFDEAVKQFADLD
jgi:hypothetical protein